MCGVGGLFYLRTELFGYFIYWRDRATPSRSARTASVTMVQISKWEHICI